MGKETKGRRTKIDFKNHHLTITKTEGLLIHHLKQPDTVINNIKFINTNGIMAVTGDFGNWIFCREFHPSGEGDIRLSDGYMCEKLRISSTQVVSNYDPIATAKELRRMIRIGAKQYGYEGDRLRQAKEYFQECIENVDDELDYTNVAYRSHPSFMDYEEVVFIKQMNRWLAIIFDGFEEINRRLKLKNQLTTKQK